MWGGLTYRVSCGQARDGCSCVGEGWCRDCNIPYMGGHTAVVSQWRGFLLLGDGLLETEMLPFPDGELWALGSCVGVADTIES